ncbi:MAG: TetR family transcriptional regulator [Actinomycetota bacterium]|nr:TetR family transcriptional regulator [Actinomycetota bacterium]
MSIDERTTTLGPWERRRIRTSLEIECIALGLIAERGLDAVTVEQIANAAGISTRTFFRYFKNVRDVLTPLSARETERLCELVLQRPSDEPLLDAFRAVYQDYADSLVGMYDPDDPDAELKTTALALWGRIVQRDPEAGLSLGHVNDVLTSGFERVIRIRLGLPDDDRLTAGVLGAALGGAVWFTYVHWLQLGTTEPLPGYLDRAFDRLAELR